MNWTLEHIVYAIETARKRRDTVRLVDVMSVLHSNGYDRTVDRALQKARKAGAIRFHSKRGWLVCDPEVVPQRDHEQATDRSEVAE